MSMSGGQFDIITVAMPRREVLVECEQNELQHSLLGRVGPGFIWSCRASTMQAMPSIARGAEGPSSMTSDQLKTCCQCMFEQNRVYIFMDFFY